ncbi:putative ABC transport system permease protein [Neorhodopirellula lusitana]|uniref:ABC transport system permease protein n=1 Tax=Neorhodopirellula lusitana TaxID=445327 RepID=A0ABY1QNN8_9BACT|nr:putative ABC transport system permease protein [Neorhodopirellula lusitana]
MKLHPGRAIVTTLGVIASTCAVVWVVSGYDALVSQFDENAGKYLGRYDALIIANSPPGMMPKIQPEIVEALRKDAGVLELNPISQSRVSISRIRESRVGGGFRGDVSGDVSGEAPDSDLEETSISLLVGDRPPVNGAPPLDPTLVSTAALDSPYEMVEGEWLSGGSDRGAVMGVKAARDLKVRVGDRVLVTSLANQVRVQVVGLIEQAPDSPTLVKRGGQGQGQGQGRGRGRSTGVTDGESAKGKEGVRRGDGTRRDDGARRGGGARRDAGVSGRGKSHGEAASRADIDRDEGQSMPQHGLPSSFIQGVATNAIYVRPSLAASINGYPESAQVLQLAVRDSVTVQQFAEVWQDRLAASSPSLRLVDFAAVRSGMESSRTVSSQQSQAWAATGMATLAAIFIIFSTLSMGVSERAREFAMLRAVALTRAQIAGIIALESVILALVGWGGGLATGWLVVMVGSRVSPELFASGAVLGWTSVAFSGVTVLVGALGAAILPAWRAMRIEPLDAMSTRAAKPSETRWAVLGCIGALLSLAAPVTVFGLPMSDAWRTWCYTFLTYPMLLVGMVLMAPAVVVFSERVSGRWVTKLMRLDSRMMQTQLTSNLWRTIAATLALSVGLGLYASTQTWGYSMLKPFTPGDWLPDMLVAFHPIGLDDEGDELVRQVEGVDANQVMPLAIEQARFDWGDREAPSRLSQDNAILFGIDPGRSFGAEDPFLDVSFVEGDRELALEQLAAGVACLISQDFQMSSGLHVGDELAFTPPANPAGRVAYRIAGVVSLPGWHWFTKFSGVRRHFVRTATMVFASRNDVQNDFGLGRTEFYWLNLEPDANLAAVEEDLQTIAERDAGATFQTDSKMQVTAYRPFARATATANVRKAIKKRADGMIWGMSYLPLVTLAIMSLAVVNTVMASVRSRTWEFGVMRSIGVTRGQLVRLVVAESILIAMAACVLSLVFGLIAGWCGVGMAQYGGWFAGPPTFLIPWLQLGLGFTATIGLCLLAGVWPAIKTGRAEPLRLLQAGRGMM